MNNTEKLTKILGTKLQPIDKEFQHWHVTKVVSVLGKNCYFYAEDDRDYGVPVMEGIWFIHEESCEEHTLDISWISGFPLSEEDKFLLGDDRSFLISETYKEVVRVNP